MEINKLLTQVNFDNVNNANRIKYIVIHYVGATGGAKDNCNYFRSVYRGASAHYFVGHSGEVWQCVNDNDVAWHCGASSYKHKYCRNSNSIGIEMCCRKKNGKWYFEEATVKSTIELTKYLMKKYDIPAANVIRHYDVTGKTCPEPYVRDTSAWNSFKAQLNPIGNSNSSNKIETQLYRVRKSWNDSKSQIGAYASLENAKKAVAANKGYSVFDASGKKVYPVSTAATSGSYKVKVSIPDLYIRTGPGTNYANKGFIKPGVYTIVSTSGKWGKLKSGAGWIHLDYTKKV